MNCSATLSFRLGALALALALAFSGAAQADDFSPDALSA